jgi:hypothetical protein
MLSRLTTAAFLAAGLTGAATAAPLPLAGLDGPDAQIIQVYGGCGPYSHRGPYGGCRPGGQWGGYVRGWSCPGGFHIGPYGRRCWPNRF